MDAGNPSCPRGRRNPNTSRGEDFRRARGMYCGLCRRSVYSPLALAPRRTFHRTSTFSRTLIRRSGNLYAGGAGSQRGTPLPNFCSASRVQTNTQLARQLHKMQEAGSSPSPVHTASSDPIRARRWYRRSRGHAPERQYRGVRSSTSPERDIVQSVLYRPCSHPAGCGCHSKMERRSLRN